MSKYAVFCCLFIPVAGFLGSCGEDRSDDAGDSGVVNSNCYTPCKTGLIQDDGTVIPCSDEGLMSGCFGDTTCVNGWCVVTANNKHSGAENIEGAIGECIDDCEDGLRVGTANKALSDAENIDGASGECIDNCGCADFGICMDSQCTTQCEVDTDCDDSEVCYRKVCRKKCSSGGGEDSLTGACPVDMVCKIGPDGTTGHCMPNCAPPVDDELFNCLQTVPNGLPPFELSGDALVENKLRFDEDNTDATFLLVNNTLCTLDFVVHRKKHSVYTDEGLENETENPLFWITLESGDQSVLGSADLIIEQVPGNGGEAEISLSGAANDTMPNWSGELEVGTTADTSDTELGATSISLSYTSGADGNWSGSMYYFGTFGIDKLEEWVDSGFTEDALEDVGNALIKRWGVMRRGDISLDNFLAAVTSSVSGSWDWPSMQARCPLSTGACYPFVNSLEDPDDGFEEYSDDLATSPIPSGAVELPVSMNIKGGSPEAAVFEGRFVSADTLHYAGEPTVSLTMEGPANACETVGMVCKNSIEEFESEIVVGGRYPAAANRGKCTAQGGFPSGFVLQSTPWLLYDFMGATEVQDGVRLTRECRDATQPFDNGSELLPEGVGAVQINGSYAGSNPLPDGRVLRRSLSVVDGAIFNKNLMVILFREAFTVTMDGVDEPEDFSGYGVMILRRSPAVLEDEDFVGSDQSDDRPQPKGVLRVSCDQDLLTDLNFPTGVDKTNVDKVVEALLGSEAPVSVNEIDHGDIYYLCWETGQFMGGHISDATRTCNPESKVTFFYFDDEEIPSTTDDVWKCSADLKTKIVQYPEYKPESATWTSTVKIEVDEMGTCHQILQQWKEQDIVNVDPLEKCAVPSQRTCDGNKADRRNGKIFSRGSADNGTLTPIRSAIYDAFRYKLAFRSRTGKNIGFAPGVCGDTPGAVPYCYDPKIIEQIRDRVDCAVYLHSTFKDAMNETSRDTLNGYLTENFRSQCTWEGGLEGAPEMCRRPIYQQDGFEALLAELAIMMGDDNYVSSFASRFDLAATGGAAFEGSLFEEGGINLSGAAGFEMHSLYKAVQYYQLALDRFYSLMPAIYGVMQDDGPTGYITAGSVTSYFDRLIRASTQKARAWSEVSKRYQSFNRPDLARRVIERAYTATYLESVLITRLMDKVTKVSTTADTAQIQAIVAKAQLQYTSSLLGLRDVNEAITNDINYFGFSPEYIAFPVLDEGDLAEGNTTSFEKLRDLANEKIAMAAEKELDAIAGSTDFDVNAASFQAELGSIRHTYENDLADICGTFQAEDGYVYPAIKAYADKDDKLRILPEPCGFVDNGEIFQALGAAHLAGLNVQKTVQRRKGKLQEMQNEIVHANAICDEQKDLNTVMASLNGAIIGLQTAINVNEMIWEIYDRADDTVTEIAGAAKCTVGFATDCPGAAIMTATVAGSKGAELAYFGVSSVIKTALETGIMSIEATKEAMEIDHECDLAQVDANYTIANLYIEKLEIDLEIIEAAEELELALAEHTALRNKAQRLYVEYEDAKQSAIDIAAAMNDPNSRIYKNDAVINADKSFHDAVREAYKATRVYEYFTSTSYAHLNDLFLVRMVTAGDYNLENYMTDLDNAYYAFEEVYGAPETHLAIISFKDDILRIPRTSAADPGAPLSQDDRAQMFTESLTDPIRLDGHGYIRIPFSTRLDQVSPLTRNHKISYIEAEIVGENQGDAVGRIYLTQKGTGTVRSVDGSKLYYAFPPRLAVVDTFFNGEKEIDGATWWGDVYGNRRFFDLPFANSEWELVFNGMDEAVNEDIELSSVTDIRLYVYYTDHTMLLEQ